MKLKVNKILNIILLNTMLMLIIFPNIVFSSIEKERYFKVIKHEENNGQIVEYGINNLSGGGKNIRYIYELDGNSEDTKPIGERPLTYCLSANTGFTVRDKIEKYDIEYDMKTEREDIEQYNEPTYQFVNGKYDKLLTLVSIMYVPGKSKEEYKQKLIKEANEKYNVGEVNYQITDEDIDAVNQVAIWYYTNPEDSRFDVYNQEHWLTYTTNGTKFDYLSNYNTDTKEGEEREKQVNALYKYLIDTVESQTFSGEKVNDTCKVVIEEEETVDVRKEPNVLAEVVSTLNNEDIVTRIVKNVAYIGGEKWDKIRLADGTEAFIESKNLNIVSTNKKYKVVTNTPGSTVVLRQTPGGDRICSITDQEEVTLQEKNAGTASGYIWDKIKLKDDKEGYVAAQYIVPLDEYNSDKYRVTTVHGVNGVNLHDQIGTTTSQIITSIREGSIVTKLEGRVASKDSYIWDKVKLSDGTEGYIATQYLQEIYDIKDYDVNKLIDEPLTIEANEQSNYVVEGSNCIIGPIKITKNNDIICDIDISLKDNEKDIENYTILDSMKVSTEKSRMLEGGEFYISVPINGVQDIKLELTYNYEATDMGLIVSSDVDAQLLGCAYKQTITKTKEINVNVFDLALRQYITQIGNEVIENRNPDIKSEVLKEETTAAYNHRKDPLEVFNGAEVIYNITIYNEGEQAGRATKITDQLPSGIEFLEVITDNYEKESYDTATNTLVLKEKAIDNLSPYNGEGTLDSETIRIKCKVAEQPMEKEERVLTNVAWISECVNAEGTVVDRDSQPSTYPQVTKDNMDDYIGNDVNKNVELEKSDYFFKGQQDDDDFEKVVLKAKYDLALRQYITKVNNEEVETRAPVIDLETLNQKNDTTAIYKHRKDPIKVKTNDEITYNIVIYNEGDVKGRASKVVNQLPEGLEFLEVVTDNYEKESYDTEKNTLVLKEKSIDNLDFYNGENIDSEIITIKCKVVAEADENEDKVLTNVAWIADDIKEIETLKDRDSEPLTSPEVNKNNMENYIGNDANQNTELEKSDYFFKGQQDDDDFEKLVIEKEVVEEENPPKDDKDTITKIKSEPVEHKTKEKHEEGKVLDTGDNIMLYFIILGLSFVTIAISSIIIKRNE